jgi:predicted nucleic acid-binding protein
VNGLESDATPAPTLVRSAGNLAGSEGMRGYDAVHLAAAIVAGASVLATVDDRLLDAALRHGLGVSNPLNPRT